MQSTPFICAISLLLQSDSTVQHFIPSSFIQPNYQILLHFTYNKLLYIKITTIRLLPLI
jgi:hypothetical protein